MEPYTDPQRDLLSERIDVAENCRKHLVDWYRAQALSQTKEHLSGPVVSVLDHLARSSRHPRIEPRDAYERRYEEILAGYELLLRSFFKNRPKLAGSEEGEALIGAAFGSMENAIFDHRRMNEADIRTNERDVANAERDASRLQVQDLEKERTIREDFVAMLSHDLRSPLTAARVSTQLLSRKRNDPMAIDRLVGRIIDNLDRLDSMIQNLLDANRIKAGETLSLDFVRLDLTACVSEALDELATIHGDRFTLFPKTKIEGYWNSAGVRRIIENLCTNAVKYGAIASPIRVEIAETPYTVQISVQNFGKPISEENLRSLFQPYHRTVDAEAGSHSGWGIGLMLVSGMAEAHGGKVSVESTKDRGTIFRVLLPRDSRKRAYP